MVGGEHPTFHIQHSTVTLNIPHSKKESFFECGMLNVECEINFGYACDCELYNYEFNIQHSTFHIL